MSAETETVLRLEDKNGCVEKHCGSHLTRPFENSENSSFVNENPGVR